MRLGGRLSRGVLECLARSNAAQWGTHIRRRNRKCFDAAIVRSVATATQPTTGGNTCVGITSWFANPDHTLDDPDGMHLPNHDAARDQVHRIVSELKEGGHHPASNRASCRKGGDS